MAERWRCRQTSTEWWKCWSKTGSGWLQQIRQVSCRKRLPAWTKQQYASQVQYIRHTQTNTCIYRSSNSI